MCVDEPITDVGTWWAPCKHQFKASSCFGVGLPAQGPYTGCFQSWWLPEVAALCRFRKKWILSQLQLVEPLKANNCSRDMCLSSLRGHRAPEQSLCLPGAKRNLCPGKWESEQEREDVHTIRGQKLTQLLSIKFSPNHPLAKLRKNSSWIFTTVKLLIYKKDAATDGQVPTKSCQGLFRADPAAWHNKPLLP